jgi:hypothetical protein
MAKARDSSKTTKRELQRTQKANPLDAARPRHIDGYIQSNNMRIKIPKKIKISTRKKKVDGWQIKVPNSSARQKSDFFKYWPRESLKDYKKRIEAYKGSFERKEESQEGYEARLNINYDKKRRYGRFTKNPRKTGRAVTEIPTTITERTEEPIIYHRIVPLIEKE